METLFAPLAAGIPPSPKHGPKAGNHAGHFGRLRDDASIEAIKAVVNAVKADPAETAKGEFYEALGYVRDSERASGLHRSKPAAATAGKN